MAKDPAFNFYTNDFDQKTKFFTHEQVGMYLRLLMAQHQHGHLSEAQMMHICGRYDKDVFLKFDRDGDGLFFNERMDTEVGKRRKYSESRKKNRNSKKDDTSKTHVDTHDNHMSGHMENEYEYEIEKDLKKKKEVKISDSPAVVNDSRETIDQRLDTALDELTVDNLRMKWRHVDFELELFAFIEKVRGDPDYYQGHSTSGLRFAFQSQLKGAKKRSPNGKNDRTQQNLDDLAIIQHHIRSGGDAGQ